MNQISFRFTKMILFFMILVCFWLQIINASTASLASRQLTPIINEISIHNSGLNGGILLQLSGANFVPLAYVSSTAEHAGIEIDKKKSQSALSVSRATYIGTTLCEEIPYYTSSTNLTCIVPKCQTPECLDNLMNYFEKGSISSSLKNITQGVRMTIQSVEGLRTSTESINLIYRPSLTSWITSISKDISSIGAGVLTGVQLPQNVSYIHVELTSDGTSLGATNDPRASIERYQLPTASITEGGAEPAQNEDILSLFSPLTGEKIDNLVWGLVTNGSFAGTVSRYTSISNNLRKLYDDVSESVGDLWSVAYRPRNERRVEFQVPNDIPAGVYNLTVKADVEAAKYPENGIGHAVIAPTSATFGKTDVSSSAFRISSGGLVHTMTVHPTIDSVNPSVLSLAGGTLVTIRGTHLPLLVEESEGPKAVVLVNGRSCEVQTMTSDEVTCITTPAADTLNYSSLEALYADAIPAPEWSVSTVYENEYSLESHTNSTLTESNELVTPQVFSAARVMGSPGWSVRVWTGVDSAAVDSKSPLTWTHTGEMDLSLSQSLQGSPYTVATFLDGMCAESESPETCGSGSTGHLLQAATIFTAPVSGTYEFHVDGSDDIILSVAGEEDIVAEYSVTEDNWTEPVDQSYGAKIASATPLSPYLAQGRTRTIAMNLVRGESRDLKVERTRAGSLNSVSDRVRVGFTVTPLMNQTLGDFHDLSSSEIEAALNRVAGQPLASVEIFRATNTSNQVTSNIASSTGLPGALPDVQILRTSLTSVNEIQQLRLTNVPTNTRVRVILEGSVTTDLLTTPFSADTLALALSNAAAKLADPQCALFGVSLVSNTATENLYNIEFLGVSPQRGGGTATMLELYVVGADNLPITTTWNVLRIQEPTSPATGSLQLSMSWFGQKRTNAIEAGLDVGVFTGTVAFDASSEEIAALIRSWSPALRPTVSRIGSAKRGFGWVISMSPLPCVCSAAGEEESACESLPTLSVSSAGVSGSGVSANVERYSIGSVCSFVFPSIPVWMTATPLHWQKDGSFWTDAGKQFLVDASAAEEDSLSMRVSGVEMWVPGHGMSGEFLRASCVSKDSFDSLSALSSQNPVLMQWRHGITSCEAQYHTSSTPLITALNVTSFGSGVELLIVGQFGNINTDSVTITIGSDALGTPCIATLASPELIYCSAVSVPWGVHVPRVHISGVGYAAYWTAHVLEAPLMVSALDENFEVSVGGGALLTVKGVGFRPDSTVLLRRLGESYSSESGTIPCRIESIVDATTLICRVGALWEANLTTEELSEPTEGGWKFSVWVDDVLAGTGFEQEGFVIFSSAATPRLYNVSPNIVTSVASSTLTVDGEFGEWVTLAESLVTDDNDLDLVSVLSELIQVTVNGETCQLISPVSANSVTCFLPAIQDATTIYGAQEDSLEMNNAAQATISVLQLGVSDDTPVGLSSSVVLVKCGLAGYAVNAATMKSIFIIDTTSPTAQAVADSVSDESIVLSAIEFFPTIQRGFALRNIYPAEISLFGGATLQFDGVGMSPPAIAASNLRVRFRPIKAADGSGTSVDGSQESEYFAKYAEILEALGEAASAEALKASANIGVLECENPVYIESINGDEDHWECQLPADLPDAELASAWRMEVSFNSYIATSHCQESEDGLCTVASVATSTLSLGEVSSVTTSTESGILSLVAPLSWMSPSLAPLPTEDDLFFVVGGVDCQVSNITDIGDVYVECADVPSGSWIIEVSSPSIGKGESSAEITLSPAIESVTVTAGTSGSIFSSLAGGIQLNIQGAFLSSNCSDLVVSVKTADDSLLEVTELIECTPRKVDFRLPAASDGTEITAVSVSTLSTPESETVYLLSEENYTITYQNDATSVVSTDYNNIIANSLLSFTYVAGPAFPSSTNTISIFIGDSPCESINLVSETLVTCTTPALAAGTYSVTLVFESHGIAVTSLDPLVLLPTWTSDFTVTTQLSDELVSVAGGYLVTISGTGFDSNVVVTVGGGVCSIESVAYDVLSCRLPARLPASEVSVLLDADYADDWVSSLSPSTATSIDISGTASVYSNLVETDTSIDASTAWNALTDGDITTSVTFASSTCMLTIDTPPNVVAQPVRFRMVPKLRTAVHYPHASAVWEGLTSESGTPEWVPLMTVESLVERWNVLDISSTAWYSSFRLRGLSSDEMNGGETWNCELAEVDVVGILALESATQEVVITQKLIASDNTGSVSAGTVIYSADEGVTPIVTGVSPSSGTALGGDLVTIYGTGFGLDANEISIRLSGIECEIQSISEGNVTCITGPRPPEAIELSEIRLQHSTLGMAWVNHDVEFQYIDRWSALTTWRGGIMPRDGDLVWIPDGQVVLLDVSTPPLVAILIEGRLIFDDEAAQNKEISLTAGRILVFGGELRIGSEDQPFTGKARLTLTGDRYRDIELPMIGTKTIAVAARNLPFLQHVPGVKLPGRDQGQLEIHGAKRLRVWTKLSKTAVVGSYSVEVSEPVDYKQGERIVLTGSERPTGSQNREEYGLEELIVSETSQDGYTVTFTTPLRFTHRSEIVDIDGQAIDLRTEIGLLSRNIIMEGDPTSDSQLFGSHTIAMWSGILRVENTEVRRCGQAFNFGRYCLHSHMAGDMTSSYVRGNSIHHSFQRAVTTHRTHFFTVADNFAYDIAGHAYFVEDGPEKYNLFTGNLGVYIRRSPALLPSDMKPAIFWTASPLNFWRDNVAVHSAKFGYWFELASMIDGNCPNGWPLGEFKNNTAHSNSDFGLRIYPHWIPLKDACVFESGFHPEEQILEDTLSWRNNGHGIFGKKHGRMTHRRPILVENGAADVSIIHYYGEFDSQPGLEDALFVGSIYSPAEIAANKTSDDQPLGKVYYPSRAILLPQEEFFMISGAKFVNYGSTGLLEGCNSCLSAEHMNQGGHTTRLEMMEFVDSSRKIHFSHMKKEIFWDLDGSFSEALPDTMLAHAFPHLNDVSVCQLADDSLGPDVIQCGGGDSSSVRLRKLAISRPQSSILHYVDMKIDSDYGSSNLAFMPLDTFGWVAPVLTGNRRAYRFHWPVTDASATSLEFTLGNVSYLAASIAPPKDGQGFIYNDSTLIGVSPIGAEAGQYDESIEIHYSPLSHHYSPYSYRTVIGGDKSSWSWVDRIEYIPQISYPTRAPTAAPNTPTVAPTSIPPETMAPTFPMKEPLEDKMGESRWDANESVLELLMTSTGADLSLDRPFTIRFQSELCPPTGCPTPPQPVLTTPMRWSEPSSWANGRVPVAGEDVTIPNNRWIVLDVNPPPLGCVTINGRLSFWNDPYNPTSTVALSLNTTCITLYGPTSSDGLPGLQIDGETVFRAIDTNGTIASWPISSFVPANSGPTLVRQAILNKCLPTVTTFNVTTCLFDASKSTVETAVKCALDTPDCDMEGCVDVYSECMEDVELPPADLPAAVLSTLSSTVGGTSEKTGEGSSGQVPYTGRATITIRGRRGGSLPASIGNNYVGAKAFGVAGTLRMIGQPIVTAWSKLASTAIAGSSVVNVSGDVSREWIVGDEIVLSATAYYTANGTPWMSASSPVNEIRTITGSSVRTLSNGKKMTEITFNTPLVHSHICVTDSRVSSETNFCGAIGHLTRSVRLVSENPDLDYGASLWVVDHNNYRGRVTLSGVEVRNFGKSGSDQHAVVISTPNRLTAALAASNRGLETNTVIMRRSRIENCVFVNSQSRVLFADGSVGLIFRNNVVLGGTGGGVSITATNIAYRVQNNLVMGITQLAAVKLSSFDWLRPIAIMGIYSPHGYIAQNVIASSEGEGMAITNEVYVVPSNLASETCGLTRSLPLSSSRLSTFDSAINARKQAFITQAVEKLGATLTDLGITGDVEVWSESNKDKQSTSLYAIGIEDNEVVGCKTGVTLVTVSSKTSSTQDCSVIHDITTWRNSHAGIFGSDLLGHAVIYRAVLAENFLGTHLHFYRTSGETFSGVVSSTIISSLAGTQDVQGAVLPHTPASASSLCGESFDTSYIAGQHCHAFSESDPLGRTTTCQSAYRDTYRRVGISLPQVSNAPRTCALAGRFDSCEPPHTADRLCMLPLDQRYGLPADFTYTEFHLYDTEFIGFKQSPASTTGCDNSALQSSVALALNPSEWDTQPIIITGELQFTETDGKSRFGAPDDTPYSETCTVNRPCAGQERLLIYDSDGTFNTANVPAQLVFSNPGNALEAPLCYSHSEMPTDLFICPSSSASSAALPTNSDGTDTLSSYRQYNALWRDWNAQIIQPIIVARLPYGSEVTSLSGTDIVNMEDYTAARAVSSYGPIDDMCALRFYFSQFELNLAVGHFHRVLPTGTLPDSFVLRWDAPSELDSTVVEIFVGHSQTVNVFTGASANGPWTAVPRQEEYPQLTDAAGTNRRDLQKRYLAITLRGDPRKRFIRCVMVPVVPVTVRMDMSLTDFYADGFVARLAMLLGIDSSRIRVVEVRQGSVIITVNIEPTNPVAATEEEVSSQYTELKSIHSTFVNIVANGTIAQVSDAPILNAYAIEPIEPVHMDSVLPEDLLQESFDINAYRQQVISNNTPPPPANPVASAAPTVAPTRAPTFMPTPSTTRTRATFTMTQWFSGLNVEDVRVTSTDSGNFLQTSTGRALINTIASTSSSSIFTPVLIRSEDTTGHTLRRILDAYSSRLTFHVMFSLPGDSKSVRNLLNQHFLAFKTEMTDAVADGSFDQRLHNLEMSQLENIVTTTDTLTFSELSFDIFDPIEGDSSDSSNGSLSTDMIIVISCIVVVVACALFAVSWSYWRPCGTGDDMNKVYPTLDSISPTVVQKRVPGSPGTVVPASTWAAPRIDTNVNNNTNSNLLNFKINGTEEYFESPVNRPK